MHERTRYDRLMGDYEKADDDVEKDEEGWRLLWSAGERKEDILVEGRKTG